MGFIFALLERNPGARLDLTLGDPVGHLLNVALRDRDRLHLVTDKAGDLRRVLHEVPGFVGHFHLDQHIAREETALGHRFAAILDFDHFFQKGIEPGTFDVLELNSNYFR